MGVKATMMRTNTLVLRAAGGANSYFHYGRNRACEDILAALYAQRTAPPPEAVDDATIARTLKEIRYVEAVKALRHALEKVMRHAPGYDWNADPRFLTLVVGEAYEKADDLPDYTAPPPEARGEGCDCPQNHLVQCARYLPAAQRGGEGRDE